MTGSTVSSLLGERVLHTQPKKITCHFGATGSCLLYSIDVKHLLNQYSKQAGQDVALQWSLRPNTDGGEGTGGGVSGGNGTSGFLGNLSWEIHVPSSR